MNLKRRPFIQWLISLLPASLAIRWGLAEAPPCVPAVQPVDELYGPWTEQDWDEAFHGVPDEKLATHGLERKSYVKTVVMLGHKHPIPLDNTAPVPMRRIPEELLKNHHTHFPLHYHA